MREEDRLNATRVYRTALATVFGQDHVAEGPEGEIVLTYRPSREGQAALHAFLRNAWTDGGPFRRGDAMEYPFD